MSYFELKCYNCKKTFKLSTKDYKISAVIGQTAPSMFDELRRLFELGRWGVDQIRKGIDTYEGEKCTSGKIEFVPVRGKPHTQQKRIMCHCPHCKKEVVVNLEQITETPLWEKKQ